MATYKGVVPSGKYTFNAATQTIVFDSDYSGLALSDIMLITNVKSGTAITIYDPFDSAKGGTLSTLTLTLNYNTTGMSNTDPLQIIVGMTSLPAALPTGAATETTLSTLNGKVPSGLTISSTRLLVDGSGVTQPVSGTVDVNILSGSIANTSFEATQATAANLKNHPHGSVSLSAPIYMDGDISPLSITTTGCLRVDGSSVTQPVSGTVGANISGSISNTAFGVNNGSGASAVNIQDGGNSITVDGTVTANAGTGNFTVVQPTASNLNATVTGTVAATQSGTWNVGQVAVTSGGVIPATGGSIGGSTSITLSASPGQVYGWYFYNPNGTAAYIHFYDTASAITVGTTTAYYVLVIPPTTGANVFGVGITHTNSIKIGISQGRSSGTAMSSAVDYTIFYK